MDFFAEVPLSNDDIPWEIQVCRLLAESDKYAGDNLKISQVWYDVIRLLEKMDDESHRKQYERHERPDKSRYYLEYVLDRDDRYKGCPKGSFNYRRFAHRARMSYEQFHTLMALTEKEQWFPEYSECMDGRSRQRAPLSLMIIGVLSILGGAMTFESLEDVTNVSSRSHQVLLELFSVN